MAHWEIGCNELGLEGHWTVLEKPLTEQLSVAKDCIYVATWTPAEHQPAAEEAAPATTSN